MCAAHTCLWLDDIVFYTFNLTGWIDGHMKSASPSQLQASKPPPPPPKTIVPIISTATLMDTHPSAHHKLCFLYKTIYRDVQNLYQFSNVYQNLLQKLKILLLCIAGKLHKTMNIKLLHTLPLV
jgi:hypothetical protein